MSSEVTVSSELCNHVVKISSRLTSVVGTNTGTWGLPQMELTQSADRWCRSVLVIHQPFSLSFTWTSQWMDSFVRVTLTLCDNAVVRKDCLECGQVLKWQMAAFMLRFHPKYSHSAVHTPAAVSCHARCRPDRQEQFGAQCLDTLTCRQLGVESPTLWLLDNPFYLMSHRHPSVKRWSLENKLHLTIRCHNSNVMQKHPCFAMICQFVSLINQQPHPSMECFLSADF